MSVDLQWAIIRNNSSFVLKRAGRQFSREANNLRNLNSFRDNGLVNKKTVGIEANPDATKKGVVLSLKTKIGLRKPKLAYHKTVLTRGARPTLKAIRNATEGQGYRADLTKAALIRASAILKSQKPVSAVLKKKRSRKNKQN
eukprot:Sdes_comp9641_c0_seq1m1133